jgi:putative FmdB family regulatory protein
MPNYQYRCPTCGHEEDRQEPVSSDTHPECPKCVERMNRVFGKTSFSFKGGSPTPRFHGRR